MPRFPLGIYRKDQNPIMPQQFTNRAQLSYNGTVVVSNTVIGEISDVLSISKTALQDTYTVGEEVTYVVNLINSGTVGLTDLTLTDDLGLGTGTTVPLSVSADTVRYFVNGVPQPTPTVTGGNALTVVGINVPAGGNATIVYETSVNSFASPETGAQIVNTVTASGSVASVSASETITAADGPVLSVSKSLSPVSVPDNGTLTYTFLIQNSGNAATEAGDNVILSDTFNPILSDISVTYNGATMPATDYTYDEATGAFATVAGAVEVPAATFTQATDGSWIITPGSATLTITGTV